MLALTIIFVNSLSVVVNAGFNLKPIINEVVIGESAFFDCTTTTHTNEVFWYYYGVGAKDHEDICLYCLVRVHPLYENKIKVERLFGSNSSRLKIRSVQREDAGTYICQENGGIGESLSAQLVVLVSPPVCHTNMKPDGLLGPNSCNIEPDELQMSCNVSYHGNIPSLIQWREVQSADYIEREVSCNQTDNQVTCKFSVNASLGLHGSSYVCETTTSAATRYNCSSGVINVMHINTDDSLTEMLYDNKSTDRCLARSSQPCSYTWKWVDGVQEEVVSNGAGLTPSKPGWYKCEAECNIRGKRCTVLSKLVRVSKQTSEAARMFIITLVTLTVLVILCISAPAAFFINHARRRRNRIKIKSGNNDTEVVGLQSSIQALDNGPTTQMVKVEDV